MSRSIVRVIAICFLVQGCGGQDGAAEPDTPDEGGAFASWDGATPTVDAAQPDVTPADGALPTETLEDVGPVEDDTHDAAADDTLDAEEAPEEVEAPPPPCETDEDCSDNDIANPCLRPACNPASGTCIEVDRPVGTPCETGDLCKANQVCQGGQCMGGTNLECADEDPCTTDMCDPAQGCIYQPVDDCCIPDCEGKACGTDGCGGTCGVCQADWSCNAEGTCINCVPNCIGLTCGVDGCGGVCGVCPDEWFCIDPGICMECLPDCVGKQCGPDGCGADCGTCGAGMECDGAVCSTCVADCEGKACGPNGCGGTCGNCAESATCNIFGECVCEPECEGKTCGDNGCGGTCGDCPVGDVCTFFNTCQAVTVAMVCDNPLIIPDVPFSTIQSTAGGTNLSEMTAGLCGFDSDVGGASPEHVYSFTPAEDGVFTFHVELHLRRLPRYL